MRYETASLHTNRSRALLQGDLDVDQVRQLVENVATAIVNMADTHGITPEDSDAFLERVEVEDSLKEIAPVVYQLKNAA